MRNTNSGMLCKQRHILDKDKEDKKQAVGEAANQHKDRGRKQHERHKIQRGRSEGTDAHRDTDLRDALGSVTHTRVSKK